MKLFYFLLLVFCVLAVVSTLATGGSELKSTNAVKELLFALQQGDVGAARKLLGDNTCNCPPHGGWISLLKYESGHEPNLAFLLHQDFISSNICSTVVPVRLSYVFPWDKPEDRTVDLDLQFQSHPPYFLPLNPAFGIPMSVTEFNEWRNSFGKEFKNETNPRGFTLRLRNSLSPGTIVQAKTDKREELLPQDIRKYLYPQDCAAVVDKQGKAIAMSSLAQLLPRLKSVHACFVAVRRGILSPWTIKAAKFSKPKWSTAQ